MDFYASHNICKNLPFVKDYIESTYSIPALMVAKSICGLYITSPTMRAGNPVSGKLQLSGWQVTKAWTRALVLSTVKYYLILEIFLRWNNADLQTKFTCLSRDKVWSKSTPIFLAVLDWHTPQSPTRILSRTGHVLHSTLITGTAAIKLQQNLYPWLNCPFTFSLHTRSFSDPIITIWASPSHSCPACYTLPSSKKCRPDITDARHKKIYDSSFWSQLAKRECKSVGFKLDTAPSLVVSVLFLFYRYK